MSHDSDVRYSPGKRVLRLVPSSRAGATTGNVVDATLIARIAAHDRGAMQTLYTRHHSRIRRFILRFAHDETVADDVVHEVFLDVWRRAGRFAGHSPVSAWLLAIARHEAIQATRTRSKLLGAAGRGGDGVSAPRIADGASPSQGADDAQS